MRSSMAAIGDKGDFFLLVLVFGFCWTTFYPSRVREAATTAKVLDGPLGGGGGGLGSPSGVGAAEGFAFRLCLQAVRSGAFGEGGRDGGVVVVVEGPVAAWMMWNPWPGPGLS